MGRRYPGSCKVWMGQTSSKLVVKEEGQAGPPVGFVDSDTWWDIEISIEP